MTSQFQIQVCPFCGLAAILPHESQEGCIHALQAEIARMRHILEQVRHVSLHLPAEDERVG
jgi:hypothetical protein